MGGVGGLAAEPGTRPLPLPGGQAGQDCPRPDVPDGPDETAWRPYHQVVAATTTWIRLWRQLPSRMHFHKGAACATRPARASRRERNEPGPICLAPLSRGRPVLGGPKRPAPPGLYLFRTRLFQSGASGGAEQDGARRKRRPPPPRRWTRHTCPDRPALKRKGGAFFFFDRLLMVVQVTMVTQSHW